MPLSLATSKKLLIPLSVILIIIIVAVLLSPKSQPVPENKTVLTPPVAYTLPSYNCTFEDDESAFAYAVDHKDLEACGCIADLNLYWMCQSSLRDILFYNRAIEVLDISICEEITNPSAKSACISIISDAEAQFSSEDPEYLAARYISAQDYDKAIELLGGLAEESNGTYSLTLLATAYANKGVFERDNASLASALDSINLAISRDSSDANLFRVKGFIYELLGDYDQSMENYNKAIGMDASYAQAYVNRGHAKEKLRGDVAGAIADFEKAKELDAGRSLFEVYSQLCRAYAANALSVEKAADNCLIAIEVSSPDGDMMMGVHLVLATLYLSEDRLDEAEAQFQISLSYQPESPEILAALPKLYILKGDFVTAQAYAEKALEIDPMKSVAYSTLAYSLYSLEDYDKAIEAALAGLELVDKDISVLPPIKPSVKRELYGVLALAYHEKGDLAKEQEYNTLMSTLG